MTTLTGSRPRSSHGPRNVVLLVGAVSLAALVIFATALAGPRLTAASTVPQPPAGVTDNVAVVGGGNADHPVYGHTAAGPGAGAKSANPAVAAKQRLASQKEHLQRLADQQVRLINRAALRDTAALNTLALQLAAAQKALAHALRAEATAHTHPSG